MKNHVYGYCARAYLYAPITFTKHVFLGNNPHTKQYFWNKWGYMSIPPLDQKKNVFWIDAASGGEAVQIVTFCQCIKKKYPNDIIFLTTESDDVYRFAKTLESIDMVCYSPWDLATTARRALKKLRPRILISIDFTRLPILFREAQMMGIPTLLLSGYMNDVFQTHENMQRAFYYKYYQFFSFIGVKSEDDLRCFLKLGVNPNKLSTTGNMKYDLNFIQLTKEEKKQLRYLMQIEENDHVFLAGSTYPGEEKTVITAYAYAKRHIPNLKLIFVPRYREFCLDAQKFATQKGITWHLWNATGERLFPCNMVIVNTFGELSKLYGISNFVFVGGSMNPINNLGSGKNPIEPLLCGKPIIFGPFMNKWQQLVLELKSVWNNCEVKNYKELSGSLIQLYENPTLIESIQNRIKDIVKLQQNPIEKSFSLLERILST